MRTRVVAVLALAAGSVLLAQEPARPSQPPAGGAKPAQAGVKAITETDCTAVTLGSAIPVAAIGEPVAAVTLDAPQWHAEATGLPAYCSIEGSMAPVDKGPTAKPIRFGVALPAAWSGRAAHMGGGGNNGTIPRLAGGIMRGGSPLIQQGFATYGSDSGHQSAPPVGPPPGTAGAGPGAGRGQATALRAADPSADEWALNDEAVANLAYLQLKKTHDAAMILIERAYGTRPRFNYFFGNSQGGREALTVAQRYPADYDGISAEVPIVAYSSLMLAPELIRIREKGARKLGHAGQGQHHPRRVHATVRQTRRPRGRRHQQLHGLPRAVRREAGRAQPPSLGGQALPGQRGPEPAGHQRRSLPDGWSDCHARIGVFPVCVRDPAGQRREVLRHVVPNTDPSGSGLIAPTRFRGQEGAVDDAPMHRHLGVVGVTGILMRDLKANPLDYVEGGPLNRRRVELSAILDSTNPDLSGLQKRGGKLVVVIGTNDTLASPGAQVAYYQSVIDRMGRAPVDTFARFFVLPQTSHVLTGSSFSVDGDGKEIGVQPIPNTYDRVGLITDWVEKGIAPGKSVTVTSGDRSLPMCSYPEYPKYQNGPTGAASSYACSAR